MEGTAASLDTTFVEEPLGTILAEFPKRVSSLFWRNKYRDTFDFSEVAVRDHSNKKFNRG
jgi:hypothetical protein